MARCRLTRPHRIRPHRHPGRATRLARFPRRPKLAPARLVTLLRDPVAASLIMVVALLVVVVPLANRAYERAAAR
ncbi:hypothetical protein Shyhy02_09860 [Streptomyces hygroscopicus subsp. hygroscopicus]|nr:hypothetical protein Shyhy02_09860 [Streptomyces hygroscopicus subsp. hygroscopicus]